MMMNQNTYKDVFTMTTVDTIVLDKVLITLNFADLRIVYLVFIN